MTGSGPSNAADADPPRDAGAPVGADSPANAGAPAGAGSPAEAGAPAEAGTGAAPRSGAEPVAGRVHRFWVPALLVLATVIGIAATFAIWVNRQALSTSNWSSTSGKILEDKQVQTALSAYLVNELFANVNVAADLQKVLPAPLQPVAGPAAAGLQQLAGQLVPRVLATPVGAGRVGSGQHRGA